MARDQLVLSLGARIRFKGENDTEATVIDYVTENRSTIGYIVKSDIGTMLTVLIGSEDEFEVLTK